MDEESQEAPPTPVETVEAAPPSPSPLSPAELKKKKTLFGSIISSVGKNVGMVHSAVSSRVQGALQAAEGTAKALLAQRLQRPVLPLATTLARLNATTAALQGRDRREALRMWVAVLKIQTAARAAPGDPLVEVSEGAAGDEAAEWASVSLGAQGASAHHEVFGGFGLSAAKASELTFFDEPAASGSKKAKDRTQGPPMFDVPVNFRTVFLASAALENLVGNLIEYPPGPEEAATPDCPSTEDLFCDLLDMTVAGHRPFKVTLVRALMALGERAAEHRAAIKISRSELIALVASAVQGLKYSAKAEAAESKIAALALAPPTGDAPPTGEDEARQLAAALVSFDLACSVLALSSDAAALVEQTRETVLTLRALADALAADREATERKIAATAAQAAESAGYRERRMGELRASGAQLTEREAALASRREALVAELAAVERELADTRSRLAYLGEETGEFARASENVAFNLTATGESLKAQAEAMALERACVEACGGGVLEVALGASGPFQDKQRERAAARVAATVAELVTAAGRSSEGLLDSIKNHRATLEFVDHELTELKAKQAQLAEKGLSAVASELGPSIAKLHGRLREIATALSGEAGKTQDLWVTVDAALGRMQRVGGAGPSEEVQRSVDVLMVAIREAEGMAREADAIVRAHVIPGATVAAQPPPPVQAPSPAPSTGERAECVPPPGDQDTPAVPAVEVPEMESTTLEGPTPAVIVATTASESVVESEAPQANTEPAVAVASSGPREDNALEEAVGASEAPLIALEDKAADSGTMSDSVDLEPVHDSEADGGMADADGFQSSAKKGKRKGGKASTQGRR